MGEDIRWQQRLNNYKKALARLKEALELLKDSESNSFYDLAKEGVIQRFEFTHELAWKVMKDFLEFQGFSILGSRDAIRQALKEGLIQGKEWMDSIKARNLTSHTYDEEAADEVFKDIVETYYPLMEDFLNKMTEIENESGRDRVN